MNPTEAIRRALPTLTKYPEGDPGITIAFLVRDGIPKGEAARVLEFLPLAFGRVVLEGSGVTFEDYYVRVDNNGQERSRGNLADEPFYTASLSAAPMVMQLLGQEAFTAIAMASAEMQAVNSALNAGANLANLQAAPPIMMWSEEPPPTPKPWWKFW